MNETVTPVSRAYSDAALVEMARLADAAREARQLTAAIVAGEAKFRALVAQLLEERLAERERPS